MKTVMVFRRACLAVLAVVGVAVATPSSAQVGPFETSLDHFTCYKGKVSKGSNQIKTTDPTLTLNDALESGTYGGLKEAGMCLPSNKNSEGMIDEVTHLTSYKLKGLTTTPGLSNPHNAYNQFGKITLDTGKPSRLLVPANKSETTTPPAPDASSHNVDHYKCYKAKVTKGTPKLPAGLVVSVSDQWEAARNFEIQKVAELCIATDKNGEGLQDPFAHLVCYKAKPAAKPTPRLGWRFRDQLITHRMDSGKEERFCVPSLVDPAPEFCGDLTINQPPFEQCDGSDTPCPASEVCADDCQCSLCGNGTIDLGEACEANGDCLGTELCDAGCQCVPKPPIGQRTLSLGSGSGFFSSLLGLTTPVATPAGTLVLDAGVPNGSDQAPVSLLAPPYYITTNITLGGASTFCIEILSCSGTLYCSGGQNVDALQSMSSLALSEPSCVQDGSNSCPNSPSSVCCSNACEGGQVPRTSGAPTMHVGVTDPGAGAMELTCSVRTKGNLAPATNCTTVDYSTEPTFTHVFTTGATVAEVTQHCAGMSAPANAVLRFPKATDPAFAGESFNCKHFTTENGPGKLVWALPTEEPTVLSPGDGANVFRFDD